MLGDNKKVRGILSISRSHQCEGGSNRMNIVSMYTDQSIKSAIYEARDVSVGVVPPYECSEYGHKAKYRQYYI